MLGTQGEVCLQFPFTVLGLFHSLHRFWLVAPFLMFLVRLAKAVLTNGGGGGMTEVNRNIMGGLKSGSGHWFFYLLIKQKGSSGQLGMEETFMLQFLCVDVPHIPMSNVPLCTVVFPVQLHLFFWLLITFTSQHWLQSQTCLTGETESRVSW